MPSRPTPNHLKIENGTYRPSRHGAKDEPRNAIYPEIPDYFDDELVKVWSQTQSYLEPLNYIDLTDVAALEVYCKLLYESRVNPDITATKLTLLRHTAADLGLTPSSRDKMPKPIKEKTDNPFSGM